MGIYSTVPAATLLDLAEILDEDFDSVATIFSFKGTGSLVGSAIVAVYMQLKPFSNKIDTLTIYGICQILCGIFTALLPMMTNLTMVSVMMWSGSVFYGITDLALQAAVIEAWGPELSKPLVQAYHMLWSLGSFLGPYIVQPFTNIDSDSSVCGNSTNEITVTKVLALEAEVPSIFWPYLICGGIFAISGVMLIVTGVTFAKKKIETKYSRFFTIKS